MKTQTLAEKYGVNPRTVRRWKAAGAPVDNARELEGWLALKRTPTFASSDATATYLKLSVAYVESLLGIVAACDEAIAPFCALDDHLQANKHDIEFTDQAALKAMMGCHKAFVSLKPIAAKLYKQTEAFRLAMQEYAKRAGK